MRAKPVTVMRGEIATTAVRAAVGCEKALRPSLPGAPGRDDEPRTKNSSS